MAQLAETLRKQVFAFLFHLTEKYGGAKMAYKFVIEKFKNDEFETLQEDSGVSLMIALELLKSFIAHHKDGYLLDGSGHPVEYEVDGAELSCWIDYDE